MNRQRGFFVDEPVPPRFKSIRPHVAQQFAEIELEEPGVAAELTRHLRPPARRAVLGRD